MSKKTTDKPSVMRTIIVTAVLVLFAEAFGCVWVRSECHLATRALAEAKFESGQLIKRGKQLKVELALLKSPREISRRAREELGLRRPTPEQTMHVN